MLYKVVVVSAIHQHESAISIYMSVPLEPVSHSHPSRLSQTTVLSSLCQLPISYLFYIWSCVYLGSAGKESTCNAGDPRLIPGSGRFPGEGIGYPLQYCTFLVAQLVKKLPAMRETWVQSLSWEDPLEKGKATYSSILAWVSKSET